MLLVFRLMWVMIQVSRAMSNDLAKSFRNLQDARVDQNCIHNKANGADGTKDSQYPRIITEYKVTYELSGRYLQTRLELAEEGSFDVKKQATDRTTIPIDKAGSFAYTSKK
jgi:hypothetical protein